MNEALQNLLLGFSIGLTPSILVYAFARCVIGTRVGMVPGVGPLAGRRERQTYQSLSFCRPSARAFLPNSCPISVPGFAGFITRVGSADRSPADLRVVQPTDPTARTSGLPYDSELRARDPNLFLASSRFA